MEPKEENIIKKRKLLTKRTKSLYYHNKKLGWKIIRLMVAKRMELVTVPEVYRGEWSLIYDNKENYYPMGMKTFLKKDLAYDMAIEDDTNRFHFLFNHLDHIAVILAFHSRKWRRALKLNNGAWHNYFTKKLLDEYEMCLNECNEIFKRNWIPLTTEEWNYYKSQMGKRF